MADLDRIERALRAADAAGDTEAATTLARAYREARTQATGENYSNEGRSRPVERNEAADEGVAGRYWEGVKGGAARMRDAMFPPANPLTLFQQDQAAASQEVRARKASLEHYERTKDQLGTAGFAGDITPELVASAVPIARAGTTVSKLPLLAKTLGRLAPAAGDVAANAAYSGGKAALSGESGEDVALDAAAGGIGAAGGRVLTRALAGAKPLISKSAQTLVDRGVLPSPGQLFDGPVGNLIRSAEDKASSLPGVGDIINYSRKRSLNEYGRAEVNDAILPVLKTTKSAPVKATGAEAIEEAQRKVSATYDSALDGMAVTPQDMAYAVGATQSKLNGIALLDDAQKAKLMHFAEVRLLPHINKGKVLTGEEAKALDSEMGHYARQFSRSVNPGDRPLGDAFYELQANWREAMAAASLPDKTRLLDAANAAHRNLLPLVKASDKAMAQGGTFTPNQLQRSYGQFTQPQRPLNKAAQEVLPGRVPDSGTAGRLLLAGAVGGGAAISGPLATATGAAALLYTRPGINLFLNGVGGLLPAGTKQYMRSLTPDAAVKYLDKLTTKYPHLREGVARAVQQMAAQGGRALAVPEEATQ